jgi:endoglucanase
VKRLPYDFITLTFNKAKYNFSPENSQEKKGHSTNRFVECRKRSISIINKKSLDQKQTLRGLKHVLSPLLRASFTLNGLIDLNSIVYYRRECDKTLLFIVKRKKNNSTPIKDTTMKLLKKLSEASGPPGFEDEIRDIVLKEIKGLVDEVQVDKLGNVIAIKRANVQKKGSGAPLKVMLAGHMDEIGFIVRHVDDQGFIRLNPLGGFDPKTLIAKRILIKTEKKELVGVIGTKPIHIMTDEEKKKMPKIDNLFVDVGLPADEVKKLVDIGDPVTLKQEFITFGNNVSCKSLDNRIAVWTLIRTLEELKKKKHHVDVYAVFTTQEEVGVRGAAVSAFGVEPDIGIAVDVTLACDMPDVSAKEHITKLGEGTAIKVADGGTICHPKIVRFMRDLAKKKKINHQLEILPRGGTDARGIQQSRAGAYVGALSIPTRYIHTAVETANQDDMHATVKLLTLFLTEAHKGDFQH